MVSLCSFLFIKSKKIFIKLDFLLRDPFSRDINGKNKETKSVTENPGLYYWVTAAQKALLLQLKK